MPKHPGLQTSLYIYKDLSKKVICPVCERIVKVVVPATTFTYLVHGTEDICVIDNLRGSGVKQGVKRG